MIDRLRIWIKIFEKIKGIYVKKASPPDKTINVAFIPDSGSEFFHLGSRNPWSKRSRIPHPNQRI
jgi:hypothetical protein